MLTPELIAQVRAAYERCKGVYLCPLREAFSEFTAPPGQDQLVASAAEAQACFPDLNASTVGNRYREARRGWEGCE